jgi:hypothetical protein
MVEIRHLTKAVKEDRTVTDPSTISGEGETSLHIGVRKCMYHIQFI